MDPHSLPHLGQLARHDTYPRPLYFSYYNNNSLLHTPYVIAPHSAAPSTAEFTRNHFQESRKAFINPPGNDFYLPSRPNSTGFDSFSLAFPSVSDRVHHGPPYDRTLLPENWKRGRDEGGAVEKPVVFYETPRQSYYYENLFKLGDSSPNHRARRRLESEQAQLSWWDSDLRNQRQLRFWDEGGSFKGNEDGYLSSHHMVQKPHSNKGKMKMPDDRSGRYYARSEKRAVHKPSAFSRIQSGLSVWDRLEENPMISSLPCSPCPVSSPPRILDGTEAKVDILDLSIQSNDLVSEVVFPLSIEPSSIKVDLHVEKPIEKPKRIGKKKKVKMSQIRRGMEPHIIVVSAGSNEQNDGNTSNAINSEYPTSLEKVNKVEVSSCTNGSKFISKKNMKEVTVVKMHGDKEEVNMVNLVDSCTTEIPLMEVGIGTPNFEGDNKYAKEINDCTPIADVVGKINNDCSPSDVSVKTIIEAVNQEQDCEIDTLNDSGAESLELVKTFDNRCSSLVSDALVCAQPSLAKQDYSTSMVPGVSEESLELVKTFDNRCSSLVSDALVCAQPSLAKQDYSMVENNAVNSIKQDKLEETGSINSSPLKMEYDMPPPDNVTSAELLEAGEFFLTAGSRTLSYIDDSLNCTSAEIVKQQEEMVYFAATTESEVPGKYFSSQTCLHGLQDPLFSDISNAANQKLPSERTAKENNEFNLPSFDVPPQSVCNMTHLDSLASPGNDANGTKLGEGLLLGHMNMDSPPLLFGDALLSHPQFSESIELSHISSRNEDKEHKGNCETFVRTLASSALESVLESCTTKNHQQISKNSKLFLSRGLNKQLTDEDLSCKKTLSGHDFSQLKSNPQKNLGQLKETARACPPGRHRTWLRTNTLSCSDENQKGGRTSSTISPKKLGKVQNSSYIRKGNSLIRKIGFEPPVFLPSVGATNKFFLTTPERGSVIESVGDVSDNGRPSYPLFERPKTPPLPPPSKFLDCSMNSSCDFPQLKQVVKSHQPEKDEGDQHYAQSRGLTSGNFGRQDAASCKSVETINLKSVTYVKSKKNQLVAAPDPKVGNSSKILTERFKIPVHNHSERSKDTPFSSSYLYYRSKMNQLIRSAYCSDSHHTGIPACDANSIDSIQRRKTPTLMGLDDHSKAKRPTISSLVWTPSVDKLSHKSTTLGCQRVFPNLFPWKRAVNWKRFTVDDKIPISSRFSLSLISKKLQTLRKRDTIYKVSTDGFSLRKAGIVSIGGSNLKWSKSIEKRSKKASEEATLAVAEVERDKRERKTSKSTSRNGKNKHGLTRSACGTGSKQGERIFRVGSARYKMDSSKRTLIKIPDALSSSTTSQESGKNTLKSFIPRRLIIGNNEYVRIGNGNKLVRDPKKLKRILASEKIRWSLHTARLKLAQKRQYCLFFTRFGKCNKSGGKCPYIHDSSKIAICTKFLKSQCSDTHCKLTHKVIPERMPDCSYFLKGLCTNINCPYRHVKVNANAPLCDGFLRGHCADGDECRKKHSYTCPLFEAAGKCPQGSLCKLRHPKSESKSKKRKRTKLRSSSQGRYFCSSIGKAGEPLKVACSQTDLKGINDIFCSDGQFTEYINLDAESDARVEDNFLMDSGKLDSGYFDMHSCDIDALIKPIQIMNSDELTII